MLPLSPAVAGVLSLARELLDMDLAWVSEFVEDRQVFRALDGDAARFNVAVGDSGLIEKSFCVRVLDGRLPVVIPDVSAEPDAAALTVTAQLRIGAYVGVPLVSDEGGEPVGMLCCVSRTPRAGLPEDARQVLQLLARLIARDVHQQRAEQASRDTEVAQLRQVMFDPALLRTVFQPIVDLSDGTLVGYEALSRFPVPPPSPEVAGQGQVFVSPDVMFARAAGAGVGPELETAAVLAALAGARRADVRVPVWLNVSPAALATPGMQQALTGCDPARLVWRSPSTKWSRTTPRWRCSCGRFATTGSG